MASRMMAGVARRAAGKVCGGSFGMQAWTPAAVTQVANMSSVRGIKTVSLPDLSYDYGALEPTISGQIMELHHKKHHQAYVNGYNTALEKEAEAIAKGDVTSQIAIQPLIKFNGGGHINHSIFWTNLAPAKEGGGEPPSGKLAEAIEAEFGGLDKLKAKISAAGAGVQGSGWVWLGYEEGSKSLRVVTTANQDPAVTAGVVPLLGIDVWEHAYYLQYKNVRPDYLKAVWEVVSWKNVGDRFKEVTSD